MNNDELKKKMTDIMLNIEITGIPLGSIVGGNTSANAIANALIEAGIGDLKEAEYKIISAEVSKQERFAEKHGFTPDCTPYYIAEQYKHRAAVAERKAKYIDNAFHSQMLKIALDHEYAKKFVKFTTGTIMKIYEEAIEKAVEQAEKELSEERK